MSQFIDTNHANQAARDAFEGYRNDEERIKQIRKMIEADEPVNRDQILWLCQRAEWGIIQEKSSWYDHG